MTFGENIFPVALFVLKLKCGSFVNLLAELLDVNFIVSNGSFKLLA